MKAISLFSGVGGFEIGFERAGIETVLQAERDPWALEVLARHWPGTERVTDVRDVGIGGHPSVDADSLRECARAGHGRDESPAVDLVYGGFPCQDLSVAGRRAGLGGERSGLWFEFWRVLSELRPRWAVIENVPGLLSSNGGRDFAIVLDGLDELGFDAAWAVLDAQHFGVPQRRRRVFIVAGPRGRGAEQVLSLCESCGGNPETGRAPGEGVAFALTAGVRGTGDGHGNAWNSNYVAPALAASGRGTARTGESRGQDPLVVTAIRTANTGANTGANGHGIADDVAHTLDGANGQAVIASAVSASAGHHGHSSPRGDGSDNLVAYSLNARDARGPLPDRSIGNVAIQGGVRRLTPRECERLMGWPEHAEMVKIEVTCYEQPKSPARAVALSLRSLIPAGSAESDRVGETVSSVGSSSQYALQSETKRAEVDVVFDCEDGDIALHISNGQSLFVSSAEASELFAHLGLGVGSAHLGALTTSILLRTIQAGRVASPQSEIGSLPLQSGAHFVALSGREIAVAVSDAGPSISAATAHMRSTTSRPGRSSLTEDSILKTLLSCVVDAMSGLIPELTQPGSSFTLNLSLNSCHTRWTADGREISDSNRYRMAGNGVVSPVAEWIGHRLVVVDALMRGLA